jgi:hypothetical protein
MGLSSVTSLVRNEGELVGPTMYGDLAANLYHSLPGAEHGPFVAVMALPEGEGGVIQYIEAYGPSEEDIQDRGSDGTPGHAPIAGGDSCNRDLRRNYSDATASVKPNAAAASRGRRHILAAHRLDEPLRHGQPDATPDDSFSILGERYRALEDARSSGVARCPGRAHAP